MCGFEGTLDGWTGESDCNSHGHGNLAGYEFGGKYIKGEGRGDGDGAVRELDEAS